MEAGFGWRLGWVVCTLPGGEGTPGDCLSVHTVKPVLSVTGKLT